jgi:hypothetical protein
MCACDCRAGDLSLLVGWRGASEEQGRLHQRSGDTPQALQQGGQGDAGAEAGAAAGGEADEGEEPDEEPVLLRDSSREAWPAADEAACGGGGAPHAPGWAVDSTSAIRSWLGMQLPLAGRGGAGPSEAAAEAGPPTGTGRTAAAPPQPPQAPVVPLHPPGRLLYIQPGVEAAASGDEGAGGVARRRRGACRGAQAVLIRGAAGQRFPRLILHPDMLSDHRTRSYRLALLRLLRHCPG